MFIDSNNILKWSKDRRILAEPKADDRQIKNNNHRKLAGGNHASFILMARRQEM